jgi:hypothetical protein
MADPISSAWRRCVMDSGPVSVYAAPAWPSSISAVTATAAMSRSWIGAMLASAYGIRSSVPSLMDWAHRSVLVAKAPGRRNVQSMPDFSSARSTIRCRC